MPTAFAIAKVKTKKKCHAFLGGQQHNTDVGHEVSKAGLGVILCAGAIIGLSGFFFMVGGLIKSGGITGFVKGWLTAFTGI
ncbi:MAG: hypothetical protein WC256_08505 [Desulfurivibrionaceae bacterium]